MNSYFSPITYASRVAITAIFSRANPSNEGPRGRAPSAGAHPHKLSSFGVAVGAHGPPRLVCARSRIRTISRDLDGRLCGPGLGDAALAARGDCAAPLTPAAAASARWLVPGQRRLFDLLRPYLRRHLRLRCLSRCQLEALPLVLEARAKRPGGIVAFELLGDLAL